MQDVLVLGRLLCSRSTHVAVRPAPVLSCSGGDHTQPFPSAHLLRLSSLELLRACSL